MNASEGYAKLLELESPVIPARDAAAHLRLSAGATSQLLRRLEIAGLAQRLRRGLWSLRRHLDPLVAAASIVAPFPAYVSFQSALKIHGLISQMPAVVYVASLARPQRIRTPIATFSIHRIAPEFFGGFVTTHEGAPIAQQEKALVDLLYLAGGRSRFMKALPEVEIPREFDRKAAAAWIARIPSARLRYGTERRLEALLEREGRDV